jgi:hypothetical protein
MKKTIAAAIAAALALTTNAALAAPVEFNGEIKYQYRWQTYENFTDNRDKDGGISSIRLNAKMELNPNISAYARFAAQGLSGDKIGADFDTTRYGSDVAVVDQYGFVYNNAGWSYKIGRQTVEVTAASSLISSGGYIGNDMDFLNGVVATGKSGETSLQLVAGNVDHFEGGNSDGLYSVHASYSPAENWTVGGLLAKADQKVEGTRNFWGVDATYTTGKASFIVDFLNSNKKDNDSARVFGVDYSFDDNNTLSVYNHKTEVNADILTGWDKGEKGFYYIYNHKFDKAASLTLLYKDNELINSNKKYDSLRATVAYKF